jgi:hypothetical protein
MAKKNTGLSVITRSARGTLTVVELHGLAREAEVLAANGEAENLAQALAAIQEAEQRVRAVSESAVSEVVRAETRSAAIEIVSACERLQIAIKTLETTR